MGVLGVEVGGVGTDCRCRVAVCGMEAGWDCCGLVAAELAVSSGGIEGSDGRSAEISAGAMRPSCCRT